MNVSDISVTSAAPEPTGGALLVMAALLLLISRAITNHLMRANYRKDLPPRSLTDSSSHLPSTGPAGFAVPRLTRARDRSILSLGNVRNAAAGLLIIFSVGSTVQIASAQFGDWVNKAKQKVNKAVNPSSTNNQPAASNASTGNGSPGSDPVVSPAPAVAPVQGRPDTVHPSVPFVTSGPLVYTYCSLDLRNSEVSNHYLSDIFPIHKQPTETIFNTYVPSWRNFVAEKYQKPVNMTRARGISFSCMDGDDTQPKAQTRRTEEITRISAGVYKVVETGWKGDDQPADISSNVAAPTALGQLSPDLAAAIDREHQMAPGYCNSNGSIGNTYDCSCFADRVAEARRNGAASYARGPGGRVLLAPQLGSLAMDVDLRSCVAPEKIRAFTTRNVLSGFYSLNPEQKQILAACASNKMITHMKIDVHGLIDQGNFNKQDITDCNQTR